MHGCAVGDESLIGIGAIVLNGARIGRHCLVGAGALVTEGKVFPTARSSGAPAKAVRDLTPEQIEGLRRRPALHRQWPTPCGWPKPVDIAKTV